MRFERLPGEVFPMSDMERAFFQGQREFFQRQSDLIDASMANAAAYAQGREQERQLGATWQPPGPYDPYDSTPRESQIARNNWLRESEDRRHRWYHSRVLPRRTARPGWVETYLDENGGLVGVDSHSAVFWPDNWLAPDVVTAREYICRYRRFRRRYLQTSLYGSDFYRVERQHTALIRQVTGWRIGSQRWYLRLIGFGPRPVGRRREQILSLLLWLRLV